MSDSIIILTSYITLTCCIIRQLVLHPSSQSHTRTLILCCGMAIKSHALKIAPRQLISQWFDTTLMTIYYLLQRFTPCLIVYNCFEWLFPRYPINCNWFQYITPDDWFIAIGFLILPLMPGRLQSGYLVRWLGWHASSRCLSITPSGGAFEYRPSVTSNL